MLSRKTETSSVQHSPKIKHHDLPFKKRTLSIAVAGEKKGNGNYLGRGNLESLMGESDDNIDR